ncbi:unnamed protein product, partial [Cladocopium goreaui]
MSKDATHKVVSLGKARRWEAALALAFQEEPNVITWGASAAACARSRQWAQACGLLGCCSAAQLEINVILESTAINALAKETRWSEKPRVSETETPSEAWS